jgi:hypothetical protein
LEDRILVFVLMRLRPTESDATFEERVAHLWTVGEGDAVRFEAFRERQEALEAVGLSE